jgi:hypothetical protein
MRKTGTIVSLALGAWLVAAPATALAAPALPDLTILKVYLEKDCRVAVVVKNLGPGEVPNDVWAVHTPKSAGVYLYRNGTGWGGEAIWSFDPAKALQKPGGVATWVSNLVVSGTESIKAVVDLWNVVAEANESNNSLAAKLTCPAPSGTCCIAGKYKGVHVDTASATCPTPHTEDFLFEIFQPGCGTAVTGEIQSMKNGTWTVTHSFKGTVMAREKCCYLKGTATELTTGKAMTIAGLLCLESGKWVVSSGTYTNPGGCSGTFKMKQI